MTGRWGIIRTFMDGDTFVRACPFVIGDEIASVELTFKQGERKKVDDLRRLAYSYAGKPYTEWQADGQ